MGDSFQLEWVAAGRSDEYLGGQMGGIAGDLAADLTRNFSVSDKTLTAAAQGQQLARDGAANATSLHEDALALLPRVPEPRQQFFRSHILVQSAMQRFSVSRHDIAGIWVAFFQEKSASNIVVDTLRLRLIGHWTHFL